MRNILVGLIAFFVAITAVDAKVLHNTLVESAAHNDKKSFNFHLKKHKDEIDNKDKFGKTALFHAACFGNDGFVKDLIKNKTDMKVTDNNSRTVLHNLLICNPKNSIKIAELIINERRVNLNHQDKDGVTVAILAAKMKDSSMIKLLAKNGANLYLTDNQGKTTLMAAASYDRVDTLNFLLKQKPKPKVDVTNSMNQTAYYYALQFGHTKSQKILKKAGAVDQKVETLPNAKLLIAAEMGDVKLIKAALKEGADIDFAYTNGETTALMEASIAGNLQAVRELVLAGANLDKQDKEGKTALMHAIENRKTDVANLILNEDVNYTLTDNEGKSAKDYAVDYYENSLLVRLQ